MVLSKRKSKFSLPEYDVYFNDNLAKRYLPIVYSNVCQSGNPNAVYYRIVENNQKEKCIQYFYYWLEQKCIPAHGYDYEPIFIFLNDDSKEPYLIVNGGLAEPQYGFHKNEIRPKKGTRDTFVRNTTTKLSTYPYFPFGKNKPIEIKVYYKQYPLNGNDLEFKKERPLFGIAACSNVFSGKESILIGTIFKPQLKKLTDRILQIWYFKHYKTEYDMPFGHDVADPFSFPHIKYCPTKPFLQKS